MEIKRVFKAFQGFGINLRSLYFITEHISSEEEGRRESHPVIHPNV